MTTSQEWANRLAGYVPRDAFDGVQPRTGRPLDRRTQIARVMTVQGITRDEAADQINTRIYEARQYLKRRAKR